MILTEKEIDSKLSELLEKFSEDDIKKYIRENQTIPEIQHFTQNIDGWINNFKYFEQSSINIVARKYFLYKIYEFQKQMNEVWEKEIHNESRVVNKVGTPYF